MIRNLKSGEYRLYARKKDPKTGKRRNLGSSPLANWRKSMNVPFNTSRGSSPRWIRAAIEKAVRPEARLPFITEQVMPTLKSFSTE
jgi:hypothetical protein